MDKYHYHNGIDQPQLNPKDFLGFPIFNELPTDLQIEGKIIFVITGGIKYMYVMLSHVWTLMGISPASLSNTVALNFGAITPQSAADLTMALVGAGVGDVVTLGVADGVISGGTNCGNITFFAWVSATDVVTIRCLNNDTVNTANPANGNFTTKIMNL